MNKKSFLVIAVLFCGIIAHAWQSDTAGNLKIFHQGQLILEETGLDRAVFSGNPAVIKTPAVAAKRRVEKKNQDLVIAVDAKFSPLDIVPAYRFRIPAAVLDNAELSAFGLGKRERKAVEIPQGTNWTLENIVFFALKKGDLKFALDFEWTGSSAFQHYRDEAYRATLRHDENGLEITLFRHEAPRDGGDYKAYIVLRTEETDYVKLHGSYQAHYKKNMPVSRFFVFSPQKKQRPVLFGGTVFRDDDVKSYFKRFTKAVVVPISYRIPGKYGNGGMSFPRYLKFSANKTENPVYAYAVSGDKKAHEFTMSLPDGYYFLTLYVRDDSVSKPYKYSAEINGIKRMIAVNGAAAAATRFMVKVENGKVNIKFPDSKKIWRLSAVSAVWIAGKADLDIDVKNMKEFQL